MNSDAPSVSLQENHLLPRPGSFWFAAWPSTRLSELTFCYFDWKGKFHTLCSTCFCWGKLDYRSLRDCRMWMPMRLTRPSSKVGSCLLDRLQFFDFVTKGESSLEKSFSQRVMEQGVMIHFTDTNSPWQNSRTEKAGGIYKQKLHMVLDEVSAMDSTGLGTCA